MSFDGKCLPPFEGAMNFRQPYLGHEKLYGKKWQALESRLLDVIGCSDPTTISAGKASYELQPIDIEHWRTPFDLCGCGL